MNEWIVKFPRRRSKSLFPQNPCISRHAILIFLLLYEIVFHSNFFSLENSCMYTLNVSLQIMFFRTIYDSKKICMRKKHLKKRPLLLIDSFDRAPSRHGLMLFSSSACDSGSLSCVSVLENAQMSNPLTIHHKKKDF